MCWHFPAAVTCWRTGAWRWSAAARSCSVTSTSVAPTSACEGRHDRRHADRPRRRRPKPGGSPVEIVTAYLARIERLYARLRVFTRFTRVFNTVGLLAL